MNGEVRCVVSLSALEKLVFIARWYTPNKTKGTGAGELESEITGSVVSAKHLTANAIFTGCQHHSTSASQTVLVKIETH